MTLKCKICGVSNSKTLNFIVNHKFPPQFIGFIVNYPKSKRYVETEKLNLEKQKLSIEANVQLKNAQLDADKINLEEIKANAVN